MRVGRFLTLNLGAFAAVFAAESLAPWLTPAALSAGVALAVLLLLGARASPGVFLGFFLRGAMDAAGGPALPLLLAAGSALQGLLGAVVLRRIAWNEKIPISAAESWLFLGVLALLCTLAPTLAVATGTPPGSWAGRWLGDLSGVCLVVPGFWILGTRRSAPTPRPVQALFPIVALAAGICLIGYLVVREQNESRTRFHFNEIASAQTAALRLRIERRLLLLRGIQGLFDASREVEPHEFEAFIAPWAAEDPGLRFLGWYARGEPLARLGSEAVLGRAVRDAVRTQGAVASGLLHLPDPSIALLVPIFKHGELLGVAAGFYRLQPIIERTFPVTNFDRELPVELVLYDRATDPHRPIFATPESSFESKRAPLRYRETIPIAGRRWEVHILPSSGTYESLRTREPEFFLLGGIVFTLLLTGLLEGNRKRSEIVERLVAERTEELRHSGELLLEAQRIAALASSPIDLASGRVEFTPNLRSLLGEGEDLFACISPEDRERIRRELAAGARGVWRGIQTRFRTVDAPAEAGRWIEMRVDSGMATFRDVTMETLRAREAAAYAEEIRRQNQDLAHRDRILQSLLEDLSESQKNLTERSRALAESNRELEQFAYVSSHDLQEPLRAIKSFSQSLARRMKGRLEAKEEECLRLIVEGVARMEALIRDLLVFAKVGKQEAAVRSLPAQEALDTALANLQAKIQESSAVVRAGELPRVVVDPGGLVRIFQNLIGNAIAFRSAEPPRIEIRALRTKDAWRFEVRDNGIGIDPSQQGRIFDVFQRLHAQSEIPGTGMGLAIAKRIVQSRNGQIGVVSEPGEGATFFFTIPDVVRAVAA